MNIKIAREQLSETDEVSYYLGLGMSLWYTGTDEYIEGRNCPVFVLGTDHEDHFTKEHYYAVGDNVVYYYDPSGDCMASAGGRLTEASPIYHRILINQRKRKQT